MKHPAERSERTNEIANAIILGGTICWGVTIGCTLVWWTKSLVDNSALAVSVAGAAVFYAGVLVWDCAPAWRAGALNGRLARQLIATSTGFAAPYMAKAAFIGTVLGVLLVVSWNMLAS